MLIVIVILNLIAHPVMMFLCYLMGWLLVGAWFGAIFDLSDYLVRHRDFEPIAAGKVVDLLGEGLGWIFVLWYCCLMLYSVYEYGFESLNYFS